ncbi:MAG: MBL fold metallo-hydrolase [Deltaproteobacteria bacterium]|nr:MBL fold metallo-hydrolase [Deltaproteobacteria bacterium]
MAKRTCLVLLTVVLGFFSVARAEEGLTKIAEDVYSYVDMKNGSPANSFAANAGIVVGRDAVLVVDTLISAKEAERLLADIRKVTDKPIRYVVNTHTHLDHGFGNCVFAKLGAVVIAQERDREALEKSAGSALKNAVAFGVAEELLQGTTIAVPTVSFTDKARVDLGGIAVELISAASSHTAGSALVWVPSRRVLFTGDVLFTDFHPYLAEGEIAGWLKALDAVSALDAGAIVPGHGPLSAKKDVEDMKAYLVTFDQKAREMAAAGADADAIVAELTKILPARSQGEWMIGANVKGKYLAK